VFFNVDSGANGRKTAHPGLRMPEKFRMDKRINGEATNVTDLSKQLGLKTGYVTRIHSLNSLAPDIVEAIPAGIEPDGLSIAKLPEQPIPEDWNEQRRLSAFRNGNPTTNWRQEKSCRLFAFLVACRASSRQECDAPPLGNGRITKHDGDHDADECFSVFFFLGSGIFSLSAEAAGTSGIRGAELASFTSSA
jgi:hypothetical protein